MLIPQFSKESPNIPSSQVQSNLSCTLDEVKVAVKSLASNKALGTHGIPAEIYQKGGDDILSTLFDVLTNIWKERMIPQDFKDASIIPIYKKEGNIQVCGNY